MDLNFLDSVFFFILVFHSAGENGLQDPVQTRLNDQKGMTVYGAKGKSCLGGLFS